MSLRFLAIGFISSIVERDPTTRCPALLLATDPHLVILRVINALNQYIYKIWWMHCGKYGRRMSGACEAFRTIDAIESAGRLLGLDCIDYGLGPSLSSLSDSARLD